MSHVQDPSKIIVIQEPILIYRLGQTWPTKKSKRISKDKSLVHEASLANFTKTQYSSIGSLELDILLLTYIHIYNGVS